MKIIWTELALFDLDQAREYIMANSPNAAAKTIDWIEKSLEALQAFPENGSSGQSFWHPRTRHPRNPIYPSLSHSR